MVKLSATEASQPSAEDAHGSVRTCMARTTQTAIWPLVIWASGQKAPGSQSETASEAICNCARRWIHLYCGWESGTSAKYAGDWAYGKLSGSAKFSFW